MSNIIKLVDATAKLQEVLGTIEELLPLVRKEAKSDHKRLTKAETCAVDDETRSRIQYYARKADRRNDALLAATSTLDEIVFDDGRRRRARDLHSHLLNVFRPVLPYEEAAKYPANLLPTGGQLTRRWATEALAPSQATLESFLGRHFGSVTPKLQAQASELVRAYSKADH
ncbi:hypothetical protein G6L68_25465 [Agrobacterium fabrum]|uniref:hypothetical protein n=1 Tax=Agrobacterium fabrum TaxID=1176649 RepID=UPI000EF59669|nr:hypothetical protein [Agrobacterium fabrum]AYM66136.1 hypothetical protein At12D13_49840 [Agrobacterium fabrum]NTE63984.1 hypothetical protein [Agrobacterium fabrum]